MQLYADLPARRWRQVIGDILIVVWVVAWVRVGMEVHARAAGSGNSASQLETGGQEFSRSMTEAGKQLKKVPLVGDQLKPPFDRAARTGTSFSQAGRDIQLGLDQLGQLLGILVAALPICLVLAFWAQARLRYSRQAHLARALEGYEGSEVDVVRRLAGLDLGSLGLRPRISTTAAAPSVEKAAALVAKTAGRSEEPPAVAVSKAAPAATDPDADVAKTLPIERSGATVDRFEAPTEPSAVPLHTPDEPDTIDKD
ncbi:hypothetical protein [Luteipulveratus mongoliensis]|uniref:hypothetical protein n=1 Tax=Luteipulveratus mongoliensis TaxID=571913 RepID=UPI0006967159|nr:hypothetical protein [Luteipulveratus mongoliensis]